MTSSHPSSQRGRQIGHYFLFDELAAGGMATVHIGRFVGNVGFSRTVAIKRLHKLYVTNPEFVEMFLDEARVATRIQHPHVVSTLDVVTNDGELFLVMEYVAGETLARLLRTLNETGERMPVAVAAAIVSGVLYGLHAAHEAKTDRGAPLNIVHRDVSPQNVIIGVDGVARVFDFGIAKATGRIRETQDGKIKGKVAYMAPEQLAAGQVSRQTDIYAAGVVLWEALTAERLFNGRHQGILVGQVLAGASQPPSSLRPDVPVALDAVVMKALSINPANRFASAREMAIAIEDCVGLASTRAIGEWVSRIGGDALIERAAMVTDLESDTSVSIAPTRPVPAGDLMAEALDENGKPIAGGSLAPSAPSSGSIPTSAPIGDLAPPRINPAAMSASEKTLVGLSPEGLEAVASLDQQSAAIRTQSSGMLPPAFSQAGLAGGAPLKSPVTSSGTSPDIAAAGAPGSRSSVAGIPPSMSASGAFPSDEPITKPGLGSLSVTGDTALRTIHTVPPPDESTTRSRWPWVAAIALVIGIPGLAIGMRWMPARSTGGSVESTTSAITSTSPTTPVSADTSSSADTVASASPSASAIPTVSAAPSASASGKPRRGRPPRK